MADRYAPRPAPRWWPFWKAARWLRRARGYDHAQALDVLRQAAEAGDVAMELRARDGGWVTYDPGGGHVERQAVWSVFRDIAFEMNSVRATFPAAVGLPVGGDDEPTRFVAGYLKTNARPSQDACVKAWAEQHHGRRDDVRAAYKKLAPVRRGRPRKSAG